MPSKKTVAAAVAVAGGAIAAGAVLLRRASAVTKKGVLSITVSPSSAGLSVGQSQDFEAAVTGGQAPYSYEWYLNGNPVGTGPSYTYNATATGTDTLNVTVMDNVGNQIISSGITITVGGGGPIVGIPAAIQPTQYQTSLTQLYMWWLPNGTLDAEPTITFNSYANTPVDPGMIPALAEFKVVDASGNPVAGVEVSISANMLSDDQGGELLFDGSTVPVNKTTNSDGIVYWNLSYKIADFSVLEGLHNFCCAVLFICVGPFTIGTSCGLGSFPEYAASPVSTEARVYTITATMVGTTLTASFAIACKVNSKAAW